MSFRVSHPFFEWAVLMLLSIIRCSWILETNTLSVIAFADIFSQSVGCLFMLFTVSFAMQKLLSLSRSHLFIFLFPLLWEMDWKRCCCDLCQRVSAFVFLWEFYSLYSFKDILVFNPFNVGTWRVFYSEINFFFWPCAMQDLSSSFSSVQSLNHAQLFVTPWTAARQASLSITNSQSFLKLISIMSVMPSNHLIICCSLLLPSSIFPSTRVFSNESVLHIRWSKYWSFSFSISPSNEYSGLISFRIDWLDLLAVQGTLKSLLQHHSSKASILESAVLRWRRNRTGRPLSPPRINQKVIWTLRKFHKTTSERWWRTLCTQNGSPLSSKRGRTNYKR